MSKMIAVGSFCLLLCSFVDASNGLKIVETSLTCLENKGTPSLERIP